MPGNIVSGILSCRQSWASSDVAQAATSCGLQRSQLQVSEESRQLPTGGLDDVHKHLVCPLCKHLCEDAVVLDNGVLALEGCAHLFCRACITSHLKVYCACPACGMFCSRDMIKDDVRARRDIASLLAARPQAVGVQLTMVEHAHVFRDSKTKQRVLELWDESWGAVRKEFPTLAWTTAAYWRDHPDSVVERSHFALFLSSSLSHERFVQAPRKRWPSCTISHTTS